MKNFFNDLLEKFMQGKKVFIISFASAFSALLIVFLVIIFIAGRENEPADVFSEIPLDIIQLPVVDVPDCEDEPEEIFGVPSVLTGLHIDEEYVARRPLAIVINNIRRAHPQHGIASADIVYEVLAEGDVTRFVAIFQSDWPEKIGSVRSARDYFIDFAFNHDAIFIYHGASPAGQSHIRATRIDALDGGRLERDRVFWRDRTYPDWARNSGTRPLEHSAFTGREQLEEHFAESELRLEISPNPAYGFIFGEHETESLGAAERVVVPFSRNYTRTFIFDPETNMYLVENPQGPHMDAETIEQVEVTNILIQLVSTHVIAGDYAGRRNVRTVDDGRGYLITGGEHFAVYWEKTAHDTPTVWTFEDGSPLVMPPGRIWICVFQRTGTVTIEPFETEEEYEEIDE